MKMPISEIVDRYTITLLKQEKGCQDDVSEELNAYKKEIDKYPDVHPFIDKLTQANEKIWDLEVKGGRTQKS